MQVSKRGLCAFDNKRFLLADGIHSLAYGHKSITNHVRNIPPRRGAGDEVLTLAVARNRGILQNRQKPIIPLGQNPQDPHPLQVLFTPEDPHGLEAEDQDIASPLGSAPPLVQFAHRAPRKVSRTFLLMKMS